MKALYITEPYQCEVKETEPPVCEDNHVLLRVHTVGLCGSDLSSYCGKNPMLQYPRIPGHEIGASIAEAGTGVSRDLPVGTPVTVSPYADCGECPACRSNRPNACENNQTLGVQRDGAMCEFIQAPAERVHTGQDLSARQLALVEPLSVGSHAAHRGNPCAEDTVAVFGCGAIGLGVIAAAAYSGAKVIAVDVADEKLETATAMGAHDTVNASRDTPVQALKHKTHGWGPDVTVEAIGREETFQQAVETVATAGRVVYVGYAANPVTYDTTMFVKKELDIRGARNALPEDFRTVISMLQDRFFNIENLISQTVPLDSVGDSLDEWQRDPASVKRILVNVSGEQ